MIERFPSRASQVEYLELSYCIHRRYDKRAIPDIFPNVRRVNLRTARGERNLSVYRKPLTTNSTATKIEHITDYGDCNLILHLITSNLGATIKSLELDLSYDEEENEGIISGLKDLPALEHLTLASGYLSVNDCEILHRNLPSITFFKLDNVKLTHWPFGIFERLIMEEEPNFDEIEPATFITTIQWHFSVYNEERMDTYNQWCEYMSKKYTNLNKISLWDIESDEEEAEFIDDIFRDGVLPFFRVNAQHLKWLEINCVPTGIDIFEELDRFGCRIEHLEVDPISTVSMFENLGRSNQAKFIKSLSLSNITIKCVTLIENFTALTTLSLAGDLGPEEQLRINLTELLDSLPHTVKVLNISDFGLDFNGTDIHANSVESVYIACCEIKEDLIKAISGGFPNLTNLSLSGNVQSNLKLPLPTHHLSHFFISGPGSQNNHYLSVTSDRHKEPRYYTIGHNKPETVIFPHCLQKVVSIPYKRLGKKPVFSLECASVTTARWRYYPVDLKQ
ncbi:hypothetical protein K501DRAFT_284090 [Backusella circina FSU 941]|nr:hypothetical protein K501DRAFT_284090 [Backusella circina FSU 941]